VEDEVDGGVVGDGSDRGEGDLGDGVGILGRWGRLGGDGDGEGMKGFIGDRNLPVVLIESVVSGSRTYSVLLCDDQGLGISVLVGLIRWKDFRRGFDRVNPLVNGILVADAVTIEVVVGGDVGRDDTEIYVIVSGGVEGDSFDTKSGVNDLAKVGPGDHVEGALHEVGVTREGKPSEGDEAVIIDGHGRGRGWAVTEARKCVEASRRQRIAFKKWDIVSGAW
jgi:hypothetical protein